MRTRDLDKLHHHKKLGQIVQMKINKKDRRKRRIARAIKYDKYLRDVFRGAQKEFGNILKIIPKNTLYCYTYIDNVYYPCPFWYSIEIPGAIENGKAVEEVWNQHPGLVAVNQYWIGGCKLLKQTDDDMGGWGLLWDQCKECGVNQR